MDIGLKVGKNNHGQCPMCVKGEIVVCCWCEEGKYHTHCDDSWTKPCRHCDGTGTWEGYEQVQEKVDNKPESTS